MVWLSTGSFFWNQLVKIKPLFHWHAAWAVGDGFQVSYWYDSWGLLPIRSLKDGMQRPIKQVISLNEMLTRWPIIFENAMDEIPLLSDTADVLTWRCSSDGQYTAYRWPREMEACSTLAGLYPFKGEILNCLLLHDKILTHDVMVRRGFTCDPTYVMCPLNCLETSFHLFFRCNYARHVWACMVQLVQLDLSPESLWESSWVGTRYWLMSRNGYG